MHQAQVSFEAEGIHDLRNSDIPNSTFVPFPSLWRQAMLIVNSFSGEEPVRAIRPMTQTGSGTFCFRAEAFWKNRRPKNISSDPSKSTPFIDLPTLPP
jgi:hypothetical protein